MSSLLNQATVETILDTARQNLARDRHLVPVLFVIFVTGTPLMIQLQLPDTPDQKWAYFRQLGSHLQTVYGALSEALLLSESWYVDARTAPAAGMMRPSRHPSRQEAITLTGRNAGGDRYTCVVQPLTRDKRRRPVWQAIALAQYDQPASPDAPPGGVLDALFANADR